MYIGYTLRPWINKFRVFSAPSSFPASCRVGVAEFKYKVQMLLLCLTYLSLNTCAGLYIYLYNSRDYLKPNDIYIYIYTEIGILVHLKINIVY